MGLGVFNEGNGKQLQIVLLVSKVISIFKMLSMSLRYYSR